MCLSGVKGDARIGWGYVRFYRRMSEADLEYSFCGNGIDDG